MADETKTEVDLRRLQNFRKSNGQEWKLTDYNWAEYYENSTKVNDLNTVQTMILNEFQVSPMYDYVRALQNLASIAIGGGTGEALDKLSKGGKYSIAGIAGLISQTATSIAEQRLFNNYIQEPKNALEFPIELIHSLFSAKLTSRYIIPMMDVKDYLVADPGSWQTQNPNELMKNNKVNRYVNNTNVDIPFFPTWDASGLKSRKLTTILHLINSSTDKLISNYKFIHALTAGALWFQMDIIKRPPNIYRIEIPGRFIMMWATMFIKCTMSGKLRTNSDAAGRLSYSNPNIKGSGNYLNQNTLFPDAYTVEITVEDLLNTFNSYNTYMYYQTQGSNINISENTERFVKKFI